jgi:hypothetical protein
MEDMYLRLTIEFDNGQYQAKIGNAMAETEKELNIKPMSVIVRKIDDIAGNVSAEFDVESENREAGQFFDRVLEKLGIEVSS